MLTQPKALLRDLGDGLILRRSTPEDADALADFNSRIHSNDGWDKPDDRIGEWTRDLLTKPHPTFGSGDFTIVEEQASGRIVSSLNHISQTWSYEGIPFKVGRPELVGTLPEYRHKRLVGIQMEEIHNWSLERGELVQAITGIPHYYKQFGYEMGLELGGGRVTFEPLIPKLKEGADEPYRIRPAEVDKTQRIRVSLVTRPVTGSDGIPLAGSHLLRFTIQRIVRDTNGVVTRTESVDEPAVYQAFFDSLSMSVFLEVQGI